MLGRARRSNGAVRVGGSVQEVSNNWYQYIVNIVILAQLEEKHIFTNLVNLVILISRFLDKVETVGIGFVIWDIVSFVRVRIFLW